MEHEYSKDLRDKWKMRNINFNQAQDKLVILNFGQYQFLNNRIKKTKINQIHNRKVNIILSFLH